MNRNKVRQAVIKRGVKGDALLDVMDLADSIAECGGIVSDSAMVILYHATSAEKSACIIGEQRMMGKEDGLFFSTRPNGQITGYGGAVVEVQIPLERLELDDQFTDELHLRLPVKPNVKVRVEAKAYVTQR